MFYSSNQDLGNLGWIQYLVSAKNQESRGQIRQGWNMERASERESESKRKESMEGVSDVSRSLV